MTTTTIRLQPEQREKLVRLGGSGWVRSRIDATGETDPIASATYEESAGAPIKTASSLDSLMAKSAPQNEHRN